MDDGRLYLVVGGCPSCVSSAKILMSRCGFIEDKDYTLTYTHEHPGHEVFHKDPALGAHTAAFAYCNGRYINIKNQFYSPELQAKLMEISK